MFRNGRWLTDNRDVSRRTGRHWTQQRQSDQAVDKLDSSLLKAVAFIVKPRAFVMKLILKKKERRKSKASCPVYIMEVSVEDHCRRSVDGKLAYRDDKRFQRRWICRPTTFLAPSARGWTYYNETECLRQQSIFCFAADSLKRVVEIWRLCVSKRQVMNSTFLETYNI